MSRNAVIGTLSSLIAAFALLLGSSVTALAQNATPASGSAQGGNYPVAIHQGSCAQPTAQPAYDIGNTKPIGSSDSKTVGQASGVPVLEISKTIDAKLDDVANGGNVMAIHASPEDYGTIIACGQIAGPKVDGKVTIALQPVEQSTVVGIATLSEDSSGVLGLGKDQIQVTVDVFDTAQNSPAMMQIATPSAPSNAAETPTPAPVQVTTTPQTVDVTPTPAT